MKDIWAQSKKHPGRSRYLLSTTVELASDEGNLSAKLEFVQNRNYLVLISMDTSLTEDEIPWLYGKPWDIEVFFKISKSLLWLTKECRSLSYDAMCAYVVIVFMRYMLLTVSIRKEQDVRTAGPLLCLVAGELANISNAEAMEKLQLFLVKLVEGFIVSKEAISALVTDFIASLPKEFVTIQSYQRGL